jgi:hypothetical protein
MTETAEQKRLLAQQAGETDWQNWGPYLSERAWGTVREDYSPYGAAWDYFPHDHARSRAYRWNEDGLAGICDRQQFLCFALALWNGRDPILKERLFGLTGPEGNHGEDVKEAYFYLDSSPTHSYAKMLYKYPQAAFPYATGGRKRPSRPPRARVRIAGYRGVCDNGRYFRHHQRIRQSGRKRPPHPHQRRQPGTGNGRPYLLPTLWFRNTWSWGYENGPMGDVPGKPRLWADGEPGITVDHPILGTTTCTPKTRRACSSPKMRPTGRTAVWRPQPDPLRQRCLPPRHHSRRE